MLKIDNIFVNYGNFEALHGISLSVEEGKIVALVGGNGAGKTTTINTISGLTTLRKGDILLDGQSIRDMPAHERVKKGVIQVPEGRKLFPYMSVYENLMMGSYLPENRVKRKENLDMCFEIFPKMAERKDQMAGTMSGGEQQMCAICRALMSQPRLLMLDEPSLGLAPVIVDTVLDSIVRINQTGVTILLVEQNVLATLDIADYAYAIEIGQNALEGTGKEMLENEQIRSTYLGI
ncbi:MAG: ABC transporter ATP-binding protein [Lachnospiraceae bacterium]|jgi:branched-chain amino acid transport system ATP-binding protein|nr:ABC transporter ATP-binding protein [Lachnospiraceae bacterium]